jgi:hypothetical protein
LAGAAPRLRLGRQHRGHRYHSRQGLDRLLGGLAQRFEARAALRLDLDRKPDIAIAHDKTRHHAERNDVAVLVGVAHARQRGKHLFVGKRHSHTRAISLPACGEGRVGVAFRRGGDT